MSSISVVKPSQVNQLTAENAKLKTEIENAKLTKRNDYIHRKTLQRVTEEMITEITQSVQEEVDKVKEENAILKEENRRLEQFHEWDKIAAIKLGEAKEEIEKLKAEIEKLKEEVSWWEERSVLNLPMDEIDDDDMAMMDFK